MPIIFITGHADVATTVKAMKAGAFDFLAKPVGNDVVLRAIHEAIDHSHARLRNDAELRTLQRAFSSLTPRERDVMALIVAGLLNKHIAAELSISVITVKAHRGNVMRKMSAGSVADLVKIDAKLVNHH